MKKVLYLAITLYACTASGQTGIPVPQMTQCDNLVKNFLSTYGIPGATFAMTKDGKIVYMRAFGYSDIAKTVPTQPNNLFRIASVSKQITSIAIMKMMQDGLLTMSSKVFGPGGLLEHHPVISTATITDTRIYNITVQQLLEHTAGWNRSINCNPNPTAPYPYYFSGCDPINNPLTVTMALGLPNPVTEAAYCKYMLQKGLNFAPGTQSAYSNVGYLYLGEIIKQLSGMEYEDYVKTNILAPLGIYDMHIAKNLLSEKQEREVEYTGGEGTNLSVYGTGQSLPWEYGGMNVNAMDAHGGWITTARDLITLLTAVDGFATKPDILAQASVNTMVTPSATDANYAKGWQVNSFGNWWHTGAIPGTASIMARTSGGYTWVVIMNKRNTTNNSFWSALDNLPWNCMSSTSTWPTHDLMLAPKQNAAGINFSNVSATSVTVNWTNGNGANRLLLVRPSASVNQFPLDGTDYTGDADFSTAPALGGNVKVVYNGTGNSASVTNLTPGTTYYFRVIEYNKSTETGNNALYLLGNNPEASQATDGALPLSLVSFTGNKNGSHVNLAWTTSQEIGTDKFEVQRSTDGSSFEALQSVKANGNSTTEKRYFITDETGAFVAKTIFYRLKIYDRDGSFTYSSAISFGNKETVRLALSPNPAKNLVNIKGSNVIQVEILGMAGNRIKSKHFSPSSVVQLNIADLATGAYVVRVTDQQGNISTQKLVKQ